MAKSFENVLEEMTQLLEKGEFKVNEQLPAEVEMAKRFNVSRVTYRSVVKLLVEEGKLYVKHGSGTFVSKPLPSIKSSVDILESIGAMIRNAGFSENERKEDFTIVTGKSYPEVKTYFHANERTRFVKVERYRFADDQPVSYSINFMPYDMVGEAFESNEFSGSLFRFLEYYAQIVISCADLELFALPANDPIQKKFNDNPGAGIMLLKQMHYTVSHEPVLYSYDYLRNDIFQFRLRRWKKG